MRRSGLVVASAVVAAICACAPTTEPTAGGTVPTSPQPSASAVRPPFQTTTPLPDPSSGSTTVPLPEPRWAAIKAVLADKGINAGDVRVISVESVVWNDGSWGCPQRGVTYTQAQEPGMKVLVDAGGQRYDFRFGRRDVPVLCEAAR